MLPKKTILFFFRMSGSKADKFLRMEPKGVSGGGRPEVWLPSGKKEYTPQRSGESQSPDIPDHLQEKASPPPSISGEP